MLSETESDSDSSAVFSSYPSPVKQFVGAAIDNVAARTVLSDEEVLASPKGEPGTSVSLARAGSRG